ncbi:sucrose-6-phosphate hydrolase [Tetragenococcus solitarius]|uniref:Sucrose-6-phosphate hydrolase n=1 Tax=Tetragenococcus solitarius TaxID=71453 RepID=A0ABN3XYZ6_9ENTE|nr:sucrose-6-phosphate hydrolase [Tetragenococcus solitarius]
MEWSREQRYRRLEEVSFEEVDALKKQVQESPYRQKFHIQSKTGLLNDPNGFSFYNGRFHLFYQWFPLGPVHGLKYWYHVSSKNLIDWEDEGIGLKPDTKYDSHGVFSGSGFAYEDQLFLFYTGNTRDAKWERTSYQCIATMDMKGNFRKFEQPFISGAPKGYTENFRDPKVFEKDGNYYCVIGAQSQCNEGKILYYKSADLMNWSLKGEIQTSFLNNCGYMWECPDYFEMENKAVLMFCPQGMEERGDYFRNIYQSGYLLGEPIDFQNGEFNHGDFHEFDHGFEFYAPQTMLDPNGRRILIGWFGLPDVDSVTDEYGWAHCLTIPRVLEIKGDKVVQKPLPELKKLRQEKDKLDISLASETKSWKEIDFRSYELKMTVQLKKRGKTGLKFRVGENEEVLFYYDTDEQKLVLDRSKGGKLATKAYGVTRKCDFKTTNFNLQMFVDESSAEIFVNGGQEVFSTRLFNQPSSNGIEFFSEGQADITATIWQI